ncbi:histidine kinase [Isoptericola sp. NEAU-Y5]|uniref:histidine kinase n=1 Tax=Isoptericola luteus TaxID=2879484 RepID=A0ABS7ZIZ1_9MICO|nr:histidine kinase [Isoptericola sp. NEAU-Y5]MCA5894291.1 histidine kinase [Isoptericola sp. NEAU-Y5]
MTTSPASSLEATIAPALVVPGALRRAPLAPATASAWAQAATAWVWLLCVSIVTWIAVPLSAGFVLVFGIGLLGLVVCLLAARGFAAAERSRIALQTGAVIPSPEPRRLPARDPESGRRRFWASLGSVLGDARAWAAVAYAVVGALFASLVLTLAAACAGGAIAAVIFAVVGHESSFAANALQAVPWPLVVAGSLLVAVVMVWASALVVQGGTLLQVRLAGALLGPSSAARARARAQAAEQEARVAERDARSARERAVVLTQTRSQAVSAADTERRRIERDLHDGAQQRLVALGVELGVARRAADRDPAAAAAALEHAHGEVKETLAELRDLVRGIHPAVLSDRGLDAALSALAARSPVPVQVEADDGLEAADPAAQAAAYFVVAEALTNVAKHAEATSVHVHASIVERAEAGAVDGARLRVVVTDDGRGGAEPAPGSGLAGLRGRVAALDGSFDLTSPPGAGTRLTVEVPCAS